ncbi:MAG: radical SAM protein [Acidobacteriota bacterium]
METRPLLFHLGPAAPTTRDVARLVKAGGVAALREAELRADEARYQEIRCRSALNAVRGMPFKWTLNPYRGCTHGCHYCFARRYQHQLELGEGDEFASVILVKTNFVEVLRRELDRPAWTPTLVALGTATDPYQPIEGRYRLSRGALEALADARTPVGIVTKGPMVVRDIDVLQRVAASAACTVAVSVPTVDEDAWRALEPGTASPLQRLRAVRALVDAGIDAGVLMAPLVPGFSTQPARLERTVKAAADHGARFVGAQVLHLEGGTRAHFVRFLRAEFPHLADRMERLYAAKYAPAPYQRRVTEVVGLLKARYGVRARRDAGDATGGATRGPASSSEERRPTQAAFRFPR